MKKNELYQIGKVEEICNLTKKTLRFYDKMGILSPDKVSEENGYRFYSRKNLLTVPIIKYYKQSGFKLEEMKSFLQGAPYAYFEKSFRSKIDELRENERELNLKIESLKDWYDLIVEAENIIDNDVSEVSVKFIDYNKFVFLEQEFEYDYMDSIINIEFTNYIDKIKNAITGPVIIKFPSIEEKINGKCKKVTIMQKTILKCKEELLTDFGGHIMACCYHIGPHENINETYDKMLSWIDKHGYKCAEESYERYVTDYWTTENSEQFVTEVMIKVSGTNKI